MWDHLSDEQLMDLLDGPGSPTAEAHLVDCPRCQGLLKEAREGLAVLGKSGTLPEPPEAYWEASRRELRRRIDEPRKAVWISLSVGPILAAAAVLVAAVGLLRTPAHPALSPQVPHLAPWSALPPADDDSGLALIQALGPSPDEIARAAGCEDVSSCVVDRLSEEESHAFLEGMRGERGGSL